MGVPGLNQFLLSHCSSKAIRKIGLHELRNQTIVIDIHNYLYDFLHKGPTIVEPFAQLLRQFAVNNIHPCFIFDGLPPPEKKDALKARSQQKYLAKQQYEALLLSDPHKTALLDMLKQQSTRLKPADIAVCKDLLTKLDLPFYTATEESDPLCVAMVQQNHAWACMSQDMDMFLYGCHRVLRRHRNAFYLYDFQQILKELLVDADTFRQVFVLLASDYGTPLPPSTVITAFYQYRQYRHDVESLSLVTNPLSFVEWFGHGDGDKMQQLCNMYTLPLG